MMRLVGFGLTKVNAEKFSNEFSDLKVETSINLDSVEENKFPSKRENSTLLDILFNYSIKYSKEIAKIELKGKIILSVENALGEEILKNWKKKDFKDELKINIFNAILLKANLKALQVEEELGLPPHFRMPSLTFPKKE
ncbi:MAG: hypothetical protein NUV46_01975 [Nanoarchaeota archaeon]|nr:hypothetical protein [Nanoarchaeota archaeon]